MKGRSLKMRLRNKSVDKLYKSAQELSTPGGNEFHQFVKVETLARVGRQDGSRKPDTAANTGCRVDSDDYGFLRRPKAKEPRVTIAPQSPKNEVEYFDDSLFDLGFYETAAKNQRSSIPITLGSITVSNSNSARGSISSDMPLPSPAITENCYVNVPNRSSDIYNECHYARLSDFPNNQDYQLQPDSRSHTGLTFYEEKAAEQRARSRSRGPDERRPRSRSIRRSASRSENRSISRGRSASRDVIMAVYTKRPASACRLRSDSESPERPRSTTSTICTSRPESRASSTRLSTRSERSRRSNSRSTTPNSTRSRSEQEDVFSMTVLEMDVEKNYEIERDLIAANSVKPENIKMMVIAPHNPENNWSSKDEVCVKAGEIVTALYKQNEWLYIITKNNRRGFVPYAYTKPIKVASISSGSSKPVKRVQLSTSTRETDNRKSTTPTYPNTNKPVTGILKSTSQTKPKRRSTGSKNSHVRVHSQLDTDSLSSESSAYLDHKTERFQPARIGKTQSHADCIVIDTEDTHHSSKYTSTPLLRHNVHLAAEEMGTYNSDSGISDPNSNHSEDLLDILHSPAASTSTNYTNNTSNELHINTNDSGLYLGDTLSTRISKEKMVSAKNFTSPKPRATATPPLASNGYKHQERRYMSSPSISEMPLGPLGARLAQLDIRSKATSNDKVKSPKSITQDMQARARCSSNTPTGMRPEIPKDYNGPRATVLYDYSIQNDDDIDVKASDIVTVLNAEDTEWIWVQRRDGKEGFIPRDYVIPLEISIQQNQRRRVGVSLL